MLILVLQLQYVILVLLLTCFALSLQLQYDNRIPQNICLDACYETIPSSDCSRSSGIEEDELPFCNGSEPIDDGENSLCRPTNGKQNLCQFENFVLGIDNCGSSGSSKTRKLRHTLSDEDDQSIAHMVRELQGMSMPGSGPFTVLERVSCNSSKSGKGGSSSSGRRLSSSASGSDSKSDKIE